MPAIAFLVAGIVYKLVELIWQNWAVVTGAVLLVVVIVIIKSLRAHWRKANPERAAFNQARREILIARSDAEAELRWQSFQDSEREWFG